MEADSVTAAAEWDVVPAGRGHEGLRALAGDGFSGGVTDGAAWALLTNGRVVGVVGGSMESFADADLTAHRAPDPALPLLLAMREQSDGARAQYYTEETPLSEVDATLRGGGFTGYVELSENVLSGDYYVVYYGGDRLPVAFIGGSRRLVTGDEAFDRADDEVGIYGVHDVDVSVVDIPGGDPDPAPGGVAGGADATDVHEPSETDDASDADDVVSDGRDGGGPETDPGPDEDPESAGEREDRPVVEPDGPRAAETGADGQPAPDETSAADQSDDDSGAAFGDDPEEAEEPHGVALDDPVEVGETDGSAGATDPDGPSPVAAGDDDAADPDDAEGTEAPVDIDGAADDGAADPDADRSAAPHEDVERLRAERDDLRETLDRVRAERDDLRETVERLRTERDDLRERVGESEDGTALTPATALSGTNLFVRYGSKADPTLERALDEDAERSAVDENLTLEVHTSFEREGATVDGRPFGEFLRASVEYRFVEWLVRALPYELRDAGAKRPLGRLYEAIPSFDRAEIDGAVPADGDEEVTFDVVLRDRKGAPLAVASVFDSREPATEAMLSDLVERARPAAAANESLGAALFVTTSYYAPDALELAESETSGGGLFGRGAKESYVRLDRSHGFHLCLVEARGDDFHLGVPEL